LLRRLMQVAPGTYNHSIMMGNLAEAAAEAVEANALLARVGAYYHDIGKVQRPEYFIENQLHIENPHDKLNPNLSKLAITAHVREGEDMGREFGLPKPIIDIIKQHHGTSVLSYFYHKAKEGSHGDEVTEEEYRYEAEKPQSPEAAIIMLADSVEAAARAMKNPTPKKLQGLIGEIIKQKADDGQLDQSKLTLGDLHKIREVFETQLWGLLGHRIAYPSDEKSPRRASRGGAGQGPPANGAGARRHKPRAASGDGGARSGNGGAVIQPAPPTEQSEHPVAPSGGEPEKR
jgi:putative nucleotidyltransferase with HDIG domain